MLSPRPTVGKDWLNFPEKADEDFINAFVQKNRRERYLELIRSKSAKSRTRFTRMLAHMIEGDLLIGERVFLIPRLKRIIEPSDIAQIFEPYWDSQICLVTSEGKVDKKAIDFIAALQLVLGSGWGSILHCIPGKLAFFCSETDNYICRSADLAVPYPIRRVSALLLSLALFLSL